MTDSCRPEIGKRNLLRGGNPGNAGGTMNVHDCLHKTFMNGKPHTFNGTEGVVGLRRWIEKTMMTRNILAANVKSKNMEQELGTLTLKGDDIEAYNNRFYELALMCPELVPTTEKKKIERYTRGFPERIQGNITSSKPATLHDAINMARELAEQVVQGKTTRIGESNKRKWKYHQRKNRRQETARAYAAAPTENRGYVGNLPKAILPGACNDFMQNATCYGCGEKGHLKNKCPKVGNQHNEGARARAYVVIENPQQNLNAVTGSFLLNDHYACILVDSGTEKSFVSSTFTPFIDIAPTALNTSYKVELADGKVV
ncbi:putative reverse transcriptase domain-containing protein, partial [Tanacetum coccineum]